jgi:predicted transposase/invertase (TIGR01784 family)
LIYEKKDRRKKISQEVCSLMKARYVNPYTDFGFKKLFGEEANKGLTPTQLAQYEESLKTYRDLKGAFDTSYEEGKMEGKIEGKMEGKMESKIEIALKMKKLGEPAKKISEYTGLSIEEINQLKPAE